MTYCFGFQHGSSIFLFADTIATVSGVESRANNTSFGQMYVPSSGKAFSESTLKLVAATDSCLIAFSGAIVSALNAIDILRSALNAGLPPQRALDSLKVSISGDTSSQEFELLVATAYDGALALYYWESTSAVSIACEPDGLFSIGTPVPSLDERVHWAAQQLRASPLNDQSILVAMTATFQSATNHSLTVANGIGVGGIVLGARLDSSGIHWIGDTNYVMYQNIADGADLIQLRRRDSGFVLASPRLECATVCVQDCEPNEWLFRWRDEAFRSIFHKMAKNWVFLHDINFGGFVVTDDAPFNSCATFNADPKEFGLSGMAMLLSLERLLLEVVRRPHAGQFVIATRSNSLGVLAHSLFTLAGVPELDTMEPPFTAVKRPLRSMQWAHKPFSGGPKD